MGKCAASLWQVVAKVWKHGQFFLPAACCLLLAASAPGWARARLWLAINQAHFNDASEMHLETCSAAQLAASRPVAQLQPPLLQLGCRQQFGSLHALAPLAAATVG